MAFNIKDIYSHINGAGGIASSNKFSVMISPPKWSSDQKTPRLMEFLIDNASMPGLGFATNDVNNNGYGTGYKLPHTPIFSDVDMTVMCDQKGDVLKFFHLWMQNIININIQGNPGSSAYNGARLYCVQYPSHYHTTVTITLYNNASDEIIIYTLHEAYPLRLGQPGLDWNTTNSILRLPVTFTFTTWSANTFAANSQSLRNNIGSFNPFARTVSGSVYNPQSKKSQSVSDIYLQNSLSLINNNNTQQNTGSGFALYF